MSDERVEQLLRQGQQAAQRGNNDLARDYLRTAVDLDPDNTSAWLWLAGVVSDPAETREALERVLQLDPGNIRAQQGLAQLDQSGSFGGMGTGQMEMDEGAPDGDSGTGSLAIEQELRQTLRDPAEYESTGELDPENLGAAADDSSGGVVDYLSGENGMFAVIAMSLTGSLFLGTCCFLLVLFQIGPFAPS